MFPQFEFLGRTFSMYAVCAIVGILFAIFLPYYILEKKGLDGVRHVFLMLIAFAASVIGSHVLYGVVNYRALIDAATHLDRIGSFHDFIDVFMSVFGGSVFYGGLITGIIGGYIYLKNSGAEMAPYADMGAVAIPLFHGFGRIGCFMGGCCYGVECAFGFTYTHAPIEAANGVSRFPVQLAEAGLNFLLFAFLLLLFNRKHARGKLIFLYLLIYSVYRFILEFFRGDTYRGFIGFLSTSQIVSLLLFLFAMIMLFALRRKKLDGADGHAKNSVA